MGYSCTAKAALVLQAVQELVDKYNPGKGSNYLPDGGFYERGREQADGAITGTLFSPLADKPDYVRKSGSFKISAEGKIERWTRMPKDWRKLAEIRGAARYSERYEGGPAQPPVAADNPALRVL